MQAVIVTEYRGKADNSLPVRRQPAKLDPEAAYARVC